MNEKLEDIFLFLKDNRKYNREIQTAFFESAFKGYIGNKEKIISLFYLIAQTQSQPSIDKLFKSYYKLDYLKYNSFEEFCSSIEILSNEKEPKPYLDLFNKLERDFPGFGPKTSALFVRMIYQIHNIDEYKNYKIWDNVPKLNHGDKLFLPVDTVILEIFNQCIPLPPNENWNNWTFLRINNILNCCDFYSDPSDIEIWDDLWFWGFFTQKVSKDKYGKNKRLFKWNEPKYWALKESNKNKNIIKEIKRLAEDEFLEKIPVINNEN